MRVVFMGTGDIGLPVLRMLLDSGKYEVAGVVTQPDKPAGRKQELLAPPIKVMAVERGVPVFQPVKIREPQAVETIREWQPEVIVVMAYGQILPKTILEMPPLACLNLHASLLPRHRGAAPIQAAIEAGDAETGVTVMHMDVGLDTGDELLRHVIRIRRRETGGSLHDRLAEIAPAALAEALQYLAEGRAPRIPQDNPRATHAPKLTRESGEIDWTQSACVIERRIRALNPWPCASTVIPSRDGVRRNLKVFSAIVHRRESGAPGHVISSSRHGLLVAAGEGSVLLREGQVEGKKRMKIGDMLLGNPIEPGAKLG
ncbi:MAG: methionyl-tRNA formyltransferase [Chthoniobacteraceae bacterium]